MNFGLKKHFWILNLATISLCAVFGASAVGKLVEAKIPRAPAKRVAPPPPGAIQAMSAPSQRDITKILERNIFCSTCEPLIETPIKDSEQENGGDPNSASDTPVKTSLNIKLVATVVSDDKAWCFAEITDKTDNKIGLFAIGAKLPGSESDDAVVTDILERRVLLLNGGRNEYLDLIEKVETSSRPSMASAGEAGENVKNRFGHNMPRPSNNMADIAKGISKVGEGKYEIRRQALNKVLGNTTLLARSARIVPSMKNGKPNGFKLYAIRPGSLYSLLGMFNGDTISAINGHPITTPDKALEVYTKLRSASHLSIAFARRGKPLSHEYTIR